MTFNRASADKWLMILIMGFIIMVIGFGGGAIGWGVIGAIVFGFAVLIGALEVWSWSRRSRGESEDLPTPVVVAGSAILIPLLVAYWYYFDSVEALIFAALLVVLLISRFFLRNTGTIELAKFQLGDPTRPELQAQIGDGDLDGPGVVKREYTLSLADLLLGNEGNHNSTEFETVEPVPLLTKEGSFLKGIAQAMSGNTDGALESFRQYGAARGDLPAVSTGETVALLTAHRYEEAVAAADRAVAVQPTSVEYMLRGHALLALGATEEALADFQAAQRAGQAQGVETSIGAAYFELGRTDEAIAVLEKGRGDSAVSSATFFYLAEAYRGRGRDAEANDAYDEAAARAIGEMQYGMAWHRGVLPMALVRQGKVDAAEMAARDAVTASATDPAMKVARALIEVKRGTPNFAQADLEEALAVNPHEVVKALNHADFAALLAEDRGRELLERAKAARHAVLVRVRGRETAR